MKILSQASSDFVCSVAPQVVKCIVEVLADALSQPQSLPVSQKCLETLRTGEILIINKYMYIYNIF